MMLTVSFETLDPAMLGARPTPEHRLHESVSFLYPPNFSWGWALVAKDPCLKMGMNKVIGNPEDSSTNPDKGNQLRFPEGHDTWAIFR